MKETKRVELKKKVWSDKEHKMVKIGTGIFITMFYCRSLNGWVTIPGID